MGGTLYPNFNNNPKDLADGGLSETVASTDFERLPANVDVGIDGVSYNSTEYVTEATLVLAAPGTVTSSVVLTAKSVCEIRVLFETASSIGTHTATASVVLRRNTDTNFDEFPFSGAAAIGTTTFSSSTAGDTELLTLFPNDQVLFRLVGTGTGNSQVIATWLIYNKNVSGDIYVPEDTALSGNRYLREKHTIPS